MEAEANNLYEWFKANTLVLNTIYQNTLCNILKTYATLKQQAYNYELVTHYYNRTKYHIPENAYRLQIGLACTY